MTSDDIRVKRRRVVSFQEVETVKVAEADFLFTDTEALWSLRVSNVPSLCARADVSALLAELAFPAEWAGSCRLHTPYAQLVINVVRNTVDWVLADEALSQLTRAYTVVHLAACLRETLLAQRAVRALMCKKLVVRVDGVPLATTPDQWDVLLCAVKFGTDGADMPFTRTVRNAAIMKMVEELCVVPSVFTRESVLQTVEKLGRDTMQHRQFTGEQAKQIVELLAS